MEAERPRISRRLALVGALAATFAATGFVVVRHSGGETAEVSAASQPAPAATVAVERRTLRTTEATTGTLGYGESSLVATRRAGTVTELAAEGSIVEYGDAIFKVDERAVELFDGSLPAWRDLRPGIDDGADIMQLEHNLARLGFGDEDLTIDGSWTSATTRAVRRWQEARGEAETGVVELGRIVFTPEPMRVGRHRVQRGDAVAPGATITEVTGSTEVITVALDARRQALATVGATVDIELPDGTTTTGTVREVGSVATSPAAGASDGSQPATIDVTVTPDGGTAATGLDGATVEVTFTSRARENVLAVPITSLLALVGGGFGVEKVTGATTTIVTVEPGMYADGWVEVTGADIAEGDQVVTA
jgi:peptidoglycan hydrolase-like protein with peptidoglycan-binding domain